MNRLMRRLTSDAIVDQAFGGKKWSRIPLQPVRLCFDRLSLATRRLSDPYSDRPLPDRAGGSRCGVSAVSDES